MNNDANTSNSNTVISISLTDSRSRVLSFANLTGLRPPPNRSRTTLRKVQKCFYPLTETLQPSLDLSFIFLHWISSHLFDSVTFSFYRKVNFIFDLNYIER